MDQNNKITLDDMVNEKSPETIAKEKEVLAQREAKNRAASNAEKFMQKKRAEARRVEPSYLLVNRLLYYWIYERH